MFLRHADPGIWNEGLQAVGTTHAAQIMHSVMYRLQRGALLTWIQTMFDIFLCHMQSGSHGAPIEIDVVCCVRKHFTPPEKHVKHVAFQQTIGPPR